MPGILGAVTKSKEPDLKLQLMYDEIVRLRNNEEFKFDHTISESIGLSTISNLAFSDKKGLYSNDNLVVAFDGVLFNTDELGFDNRATYPEIAAQLLEQHGEEFVQKLRGNFVIAVYNKQDHILRIYNDHFSSKAIYYLKNGNDFYFCSEIKGLLPVGKTVKTLNRLALIDIFALGYVCGNKTLVKEIERLPAGSYIKYGVSESKLEVKSYYEMDNGTLDLTEAELIEELKEAFFKAVDRILRTTVDNGYKPLITLSGGLDSRAVAAAGKKLGYSPLFTLNFSESDSEEDIYAKKVARALGSYHIFQAYDGGNWLIDYLDKCTIAGESVFHYIDVARMIFSLSNINAERFGIVHTGILGDTIMGSHITESDLKKIGHPFTRNQIVTAITNRLGFSDFEGLKLLLGNIGNSSKLLQELRASISDSLDHCAEKDDNWCRSLHKWDILNRQRALFSYSRGIEEFMEYSSPFYDVDFFNLAARIPYEWKLGQRIYIRLLKKEIYTSELNSIPWTKVSAPLRENLKLMKLECRIRRAPGYILRRISQEYWRKAPGHSYNYWIWSNKRLRDFMLDELKDLAETEILYIDRSRFGKFLDEWHKNPQKHKKCLINLIYLLSLKKCSDLWGNYLST